VVWQCTAPIRSATIYSYPTRGGRDRPRHPAEPALHRPPVASPITTAPAAALAWARCRHASTRSSRTNASSA
jgi:hypothetical protein